MLQSYNDAIEYLERLVATPVVNEPGAGLQRARLMLDRVGNPQRLFASVQVTGSSGKGSTSAMTAAVLRAAGYRTGVFASPHLEEYTERIAVDGNAISRAGWTRLLNRLHPLIEEMAAGALPGYTLGRPALLQVLWPMAALYFAEQGVQMAVVEVGMGGRYDSTSANDARVAILTNVSLEHTQQLGTTIAEIARHKAGVARPGGILVTAAQHPDALTVIRDECERVGTTLWRVTPDGTSEVRYDGDNESLSVNTPLRRHANLRLHLQGRHQRANAACAVAAGDALENLGIARVAEEAVRKGLEEVEIAGRLEHAADDPLTILDGAHNPDAARALAAALPELLPGQPLVLLLGILGDKDIVAMVDALAPLARAIIVAEPPWSGRIGRAAEVAALARRHCSDVTLEPEVAIALQLAQGKARGLGLPLVVAGSLILVGAVRPLLHAR